MKFLIGTTYYLRSNRKDFAKDEQVTIIERKKRGKVTLVTVENIEGKRLYNLSVKFLRKKK